MIKRLAENTLKRAKIRQWHQQQVSGLIRAFKSDANLGSSHKAEQIAKVEELRETVRARLDHLEQLSKELLQIVRQVLSPCIGLSRLTYRPSRNLLGYPSVKRAVLNASAL